VRVAGTEHAVLAVGGPRPRVAEASLHAVVSLAPVPLSSLHLCMNPDPTTLPNRQSMRHACVAFAPSYAPPAGPREP